MTAEQRLEAKLAGWGVDMPPASEPKGVYTPLLVQGNLAFASGHLPVHPDGELVTGRLGEELDVAAGYEAARRVGLAMLATLRKALGSLDRVRRVVKVLGAVNCVPDFTAQPAVLNGFSELMVEIFGPEAGVAARSAIGVASLPLGVPVEIEALFEIEP